MARPLSRRAVYLGTIVAIAALVAGFAAAALTTTITASQQNGFGVTAPGNTMYSGTGASQSTNIVFTTAGTCTASGGTVAPASGTTTANVFVTGEVACQTSAADWFEEISFTSTTVPSVSPSDVFAITVGSNAPISVTVSYAGLTAGTSVVTTNVFYELGSSATATSSAVGITGS
jgi:hypothetical protein